MWNAFAAWFQSPAGQRVLDSAVIPALAILVAGVLAALIARGAVRALLARADRDAVAGSVAALVEVARVRASDSADRAEAERIERLRSEADIRLRLARPRGAALAADWASLRLDAIVRGAASPVGQVTADADEVRERLLAWVARPKRAKRLFAADVERFRTERDAGRPGSGVARSAPPAAPTGEPAEAPTAASAPAPATSQAPDDSTGSAAVAARLKTHKGRIENQPEPVSAREQNRREEPQRDQPAARAETASPGAEQPPGTEPVLIQRTRLDSLDRAAEDARLEHARHARAGTAAAVAAGAPAEPVAPAPEAPSAPAPAPASAPAPAAPPTAAAPEVPATAAPTAEEQPPPAAQKQPVPAWLDTYDDEADVTRDIDLSKTPPPMSASAVRDRTRTGDDIVPRH